MKTEKIPHYEIDELESLKKQVTELKSQLAKSNIINQNIIRKAMRGSSSWLDRLVKFEIILIPFLAFILGGFAYLKGTSLWPSIVALVMMVISAWLDWYTLRIAKKNILTLSMSTLKKRLVQQKRYRFIQTVIETPLTIIWMVWYVVSVSSGLDMDNEIGDYLKIILGITLCFGILLASIIIVYIYKKAQKTNNELIETIETNEEISG